MTLLLWLACRGHFEATTGTDLAVDCPPSSEIYLAPDHIVVESGCGRLFFDSFSWRGSGPLRLDLLSDGHILLPALVADGGDGVVTGVRMGGVHDLDGVETLWAARHARDASGPSEVDEVLGASRDPEGWPLWPAPQELGQGTSSWSMLAGRGTTSALHMGAVRASVASVSFAIGEAEVDVVWGDRGERWDVPDGTTLYLDPVRLEVGGDGAGLEAAWAGAVADEVGLAAPRGSALRRWAGEVDAAGLSEELAVEGVPRPDLWSIGEGWQATAGSLATSTGWPDGVSGAVAAAAPEGVELSWAPWCVDEGEPLAVEGSPALWVKGADGQPLIVDGCLALDVTSEEGGALLAEQAVALAATGIVGVVLTRGDVGSAEGGRAVPMSGTSAFGLALEQLGEAMPNVERILASGPWLAAVGRVERASWGEGRAADWSTAAARTSTSRWWAVDPGAWAPTSRWERAASVALGQVETVAAPRQGVEAADWATVWDIRALPWREGVIVAPSRSRALANTAFGGVPAVWARSGGAVVHLNPTDAPLEVAPPAGASLLWDDDDGGGTLPPIGAAVWVPSGLAHGPTAAGQLR